jgi:L-2-deoxyfucosyltransferase
LAWALRAAGHDVRVASQPDLVDAITGAGLTAVEVGPPLNAGQWSQDVVDEVAEMWGFTGDDLWGPGGRIRWELFDLCELDPERLGYDYAQMVLSAWTSLDFQLSSSPAMIDDLVEFAQRWQPDLVIRDPSTFAGSVAAIASGAAHARLLFGLDVVAHMRERYLGLLADRPVRTRDDPFREWLGPVLARYGHAFTEDSVVGQWTVDPLPGSLRLPVDHHYLPMRYTPYNGRAVLPEWLRTPSSRPRVCLTLGRSFRETLGGDHASVAELLDAVAELDIEVIATLDRRQLPAGHKIPGNVRTVEFVNLDVLLPTCAAIIHHGGSGTSQTALAHGVPQVIVPTVMLDNHLKSWRVEAAGAALCLPDATGFTARDVRDLLERVLKEPSFAQQAAALRTEMLAAPTPAELVPALQRLTAAQR